MGGRGLPKQVKSKAGGDPTGKEHTLDQLEELVIGGNEDHVELVIGRWLPRA
jgi:hypothetical protein